MNSIKGHIVDIYHCTIFPGEVIIKDGLIEAINPTTRVPDQYIMPGFIDAHIHIESSMLVPYEFARVALRHGTVATVSDPHEIANVLGEDGVEYMIENAKGAGLKFHFGAPSCVPATTFESAGAVIDHIAVEKLLQSNDIYYLSEMMNYPGVLHDDPEVMAKLSHAKKLGKPIDGHAPGLRGESAKKYIEAGISTDHECYTLEEAQEKLSLGMKVIIREGSAAKNFEALHPIIEERPRRLMFCSDDKHPDDLLLGHINLLVLRALEQGYDLFDVLRIACINPKEHYGLRSGTMLQGDPADFIVVKDLKNFEIISTFIDGQRLVHDGYTALTDRPVPIVNHFATRKLPPSSFRINEKRSIWPVIKAINGELITEKLMLAFEQATVGDLVLNIKNDILKVAVVNRYHEAPIALGLINGFGLKDGAIASTVAHDSHNIIAIGTNDKDLSRVVNLLMESKGGLSAVSGSEEMQLALPVAGLMSDQPCDVVGKEYGLIDRFVKKMGSQLTAPFMTLSFMALLVIPKIKMSDKGIFDAEAFEFY